MTAICILMIHVGIFIVTYYIVSDIIVRIRKNWEYLIMWKRFTLCLQLVIESCSQSHWLQLAPLTNYDSVCRWGPKLYVLSFGAMNPPYPSLPLWYKPAPARATLGNGLTACVSIKGTVLRPMSFSKSVGPNSTYWLDPKLGIDGSFESVDLSGFTKSKRVLWGEKREKNRCYQQSSVFHQAKYINSNPAITYFREVSSFPCQKLLVSGSISFPVVNSNGVDLISNRRCEFTFLNLTPGG